MPLIDPNVEGRFLNHREVYHIWERYEHTISDIQSNNSLIKEQALASLKSLLHILEQQESAFYNRYQIKNINDIKQFNQRAMEWKQTGMNCLLSQNFIGQIFSQIVTDIIPEEVINVLNEILQKTLETTPAEVFEQKQMNNLAKIVNDFLSTDEKKVAFQSSGSAGLNARYEVIGNAQQGFTVVAKEGAIPKSAEARLAKLTAKNEDLTNHISVIRLKFDDIKKIIYRAVAQIVSDQKALAAFNYELHNRKADAYNYCVNRQVLQGFLGELYWNAGLSYILNINGASLPVGNLKNKQGKSLSIDTILNDVGFQIKNWSSKEMIEKNEHTTRLKRQFGNFVINNAGIPQESEIGSILLDMFAAYSYNKPVDDDEYKNDLYDEYQSRYESAYSFITNNQFQDLNNLFSYYLNHILRIDTGSELPDQMLINEQSQFYNTFWLINDRIYPSSYIIRNLIERLENKAPTSYANFEIISLIDTRDPNASWPYTSSVSAFDNVKLSNSVKITYETTLNLGLLLKEIEEGK